MAEEVEMTPVEATPSAPPIVNPITRKPVAGAPTAALKPGLKLPPKPGATVALKPGLKLPPKPVIHKPGATVSAVKPLPKPVSPVATPTPAAAEAKPAAQPMAVDAQGVGKLPTVAAQAVTRDDVKPVVSENPKPMEALKSVTQKLKGITQQIPQQAILRKTGIIADAAMTDAQKQAAKSKTARISLSDAMGVAPVKNEAAPIKTIRIKRPVGISTASMPAPTVEKPAPAAESAPAAAPAAAAASATDEASTMTQRKTLKITRPGGGAVRPTGKFGIKRPATEAAPTQAAAAPADGAVADIADIPSIPDMPAVQAPAASDGPAWLWTLSAIVQVAACGVIGALAWFLYQNTQTQYF